MKLFILQILFLILSPKSTFANYPYYFFDETKVKISSANFHRYIIPQAIALTKEYYHILRKLNPLHSEIVELKSKVEKLRFNYSIRKLYCYKTPGLCLQELSLLFVNANQIDQILLKLKVKHAKRLNKESLVYADEILLVSQKIDEISAYTYQLIHMLEEQLLVLNTRFEIYSSASKNMNQLILKMVSRTNMIITAYVPTKYKPEFDFLWTNFITYLEKYIIRDKNPKYLIKHLGDLNISWNSFHMKLAKGNLNFPPRLLKIISLQHNRWNSILKVILRR